MKRTIAMLLFCFMLVSLTGGAMAESQNEPVTFTIFIDHPWYPVEAFTGIIPEEITRLTGVTLDPTIALDDQQLGVLIGSGDMPDLVFTSSLIDQMSNPDISYSFEELIAQYDTGWEIPAKQLGIARGYSEDETAYTVLMHYSEQSDWEDSSSVPMVGSLIYRTDLLEKIGSPAITSFDELYDVFAQMKENQSEFGLDAVLKLNENWNTIVFRYLIGMGQLEFIEQEDGHNVHYSRDPRYKEMLAWLNKCWRAGFISPDESYFVKGSESVPYGTWFASAGCTQNMIPGALAETKKVNESYGLAELVPFDASSYVLSDVGWSGVFITKSCDNPEAAIKFIQWMFTPEAQALTQMGRPDIDYTLNESGLPVFSDAWIAALNDGTHNQVYNPWFYLGGSEIVEADSRVAPTDPALVADAYAKIREKYDNLPWVMAALPKGFADEKVILDKIQEMIKTYEPKIIMAESDEAFEALYDEYIENAKKTGVETLEAYMDEKIVEVMPLYQ